MRRFSILCIICTCFFSQSIGVKLSLGYANHLHYSSNDKKTYSDLYRINTKDASIANYFDNSLIYHLALIYKVKIHPDYFMRFSYDMSKEELKTKDENSAIILGETIDIRSSGLSIGLGRFIRSDSLSNVYIRFALNNKHYTGMSYTNDADIKNTYKDKGFALLTSGIEYFIYPYLGFSFDVSYDIGEIERDYIIIKKKKEINDNITPTGDLYLSDNTFLIMVGVIFQLNY